MYKWLLAWRYLHTKVVALFGVASVTLCVAMVLVVMSVMGGFLETVRTKSKALLSEIVLDPGTLQGFPLYEEFTEYLQEELPDTVRLATPAIYSYAVFRVPLTTYTNKARVLGIRLDEYRRLNDFGEGLHYDRYFPGTTHLGPQRMPVAGFDEFGTLRLPDDLAKANARWQAEETDAGEIAAYLDNPFERAFLPNPIPPTSGDRVFVVDAGDAGYAGDRRPGIILGCDLIHERRADGKFSRWIAKGTEVALTLMPLSPAGNPLGEPPVRVALRYADDSHTGIYEVDELNVYVDFEMIQHKLAMDPQPLVSGGFTKPRASQLLVGLHDGVDLYEARDRIRAAWHEFRMQHRDGLTDSEARSIDFVDVYTWEDLQSTFIAAVEKERILMLIILGVICLVAIVLLGLIFYMIVEKKTRDIGVLKALGASGRGIASLFLVYATSVGVVGAVLGAILGSQFVWHINDIQDLLASLHPQLRVWSPEIYSFDKIPEVVKQADVIWVTIIAVLASMVGSLIPACIAGAVWPVKALRYE